MTIAKIPTETIYSMGEINLAQDTETAINNNSSMISERHTSSGNTASSQSKKLRTMEELEDAITISMAQLHADLVKAQSSCEAEQVGYASAQIAYNNNRSKYSMGMLSETEWIQAQISFAQKQLSFESAELELLQAFETYYWATQGILEVD